MSSTFVGLSITTRALNAAKIGLATTTNNEANVDTTGYSRQLVNQSAVGPAAVYQRSMVSGGVEVTSATRARSFRLDQKYWQENSAAGKDEVTSAYLTEVEDVFGTTSSSTITTSLNNFYTNLAKLSTDSSANRSTAVEYAEALCTTLNTVSGSLTSMRSDLNSAVQSSVDEINGYSAEIAELNKEITAASASGSTPNELEDSRDLLVDKLSSLVGVEVTKEESGAYDISIEGTRLVSGDEAKKLECYTVTDNSSSQYGMLGIRWADTGSSFNSGDTGSLNGYLEMRDGKTADSQGIPYYISQLDEFTRTFAKAFNEGVTVDGTTYSGSADGYASDGTTGTRFFTYDNVTSSDMISSTATDAEITAAYQKLTAANICVSADIEADTGKIGLASTAGGSGDTNNLSNLEKICQDVDIYGNCTTQELYNVLIAKVSGASASATTQYNLQSARATYINTSRTSISGVNTNEETSNMTIYQQAYDASCSMTSTWQEVYEATINMVDD